MNDTQIKIFNKTLDIINNAESIEYTDNQWKKLIDNTYIIYTSHDSFKISYKRGGDIHKGYLDNGRIINSAICNRMSQLRDKKTNDNLNEFLNA